MARQPLDGTWPGVAVRVSRRRLPYVLGALATQPPDLHLHLHSPRRPRPATGPTPTASDVERIAAIGPVALPELPLEVHVARVVLPAGVMLPSATPSGVRMLVVAAGTLTVELANPAPSAMLARGASPGQSLVAPAGRSIALDARAIVGVGNVGTRPVVILDAAVFGAGDRPPARAFTTDSGVGFQVLAGGVAGPPPAGPCTVALLRLNIAPGETIAMTGTALVYAESGTGWASATADGVRYARAAGQAPGSSAGPWRDVGGSREAPLTAGSALLLGRAAAATIGNAGQRAVRLLVVTVHPDQPGPAPVDGPEPAGTGGAPGTMPG